MFSFGDDVGFAHNDAANATQCGDVNASITLTTNIISNGTCFQINANNIILDCAGYTITGNHTIRDNVINMSVADGYGVSLININRVIILNNTITTIGTSAYGLYIQSTSTSKERN